MEFARNLKKRCVCGTNKDTVLSEEKHENCVYNLKFRDLIEEFPEQEGLLRKLWLLAVSTPDYGWQWDSLQKAYPMVPGLKKLGKLGHSDPKYWEIMEKLKGLEVDFRLDDYLDEKRHMCVVNESQLWELTECLGDDRPDKDRPVTKGQLMKCLSKPLTHELKEAVEDEQVIAFCEEMRYY